MGQDADYSGPAASPVLCPWPDLSLGLSEAGQGKAQEEDSGSEACCLSALSPRSRAGVCVHVCVCALFPDLYLVPLRCVLPVMLDQRIP